MKSDRFYSWLLSLTVLVFFNIVCALVPDQRGSYLKVLLVLLLGIGSIWAFWTISRKAGNGRLKSVLVTILWVFVTAYVGVCADMQVNGFH
jgi:hypothetical protein